MAKFSIKSIALKWHFFTFLSTLNVYAEYYNLFLKQLGFNPAQIGFTTLMGLPNLLAPLYLLLGEKFRARKTVLIVVAVAFSVCCVLPVLSLIVPALQPKCYSKTLIDSFEVTQQAQFRNTPLPLKYANTTNIINRSVVSSKENIHLSRFNLTTPFTTPLAKNSSHLDNPIFLSKIHHSQPWISALFLMLILSRSQLVMLESTDLALANVAAMTYAKDGKASYGAYFMWSHLGTAVSISSVAGLAWFIKIPICGVEKSGYFMAFVLGFVLTLLSMLSLPWFKFEYNEKKSFNWSGVKSDVLNAHYIFMFIVQFYFGLCLSYQIYWEFWYLDSLSASPLLLGGAVLIRRPIVAFSSFASNYLMKKIGDLNTICFTLFLYSLSFLALSFTRIAWLVLIVDTFQAAANGIGYCAFTVLFYKASSTENSGFILGMYLDFNTTISIFY